MVTQTVDLFNLIFIEILKISQDNLFKYPTLQDQILYLILIPHVLLFLFLFAFSRGIVARFISGHRGLQYLVGLVAYVYIVYAGWYGSFLVPLLIGWFTIALVLGLFLFLVSIVWHPAAAASGGRLLGAAAAEVGKKASKGKEIERLEDELKFVRKQLRDLKGRRHANPAAEYEYNSYMRQEKALKDAIKRLGG